VEVDESQGDGVELGGEVRIPHTAFAQYAPFEVRVREHGALATNGVDERLQAQAHRRFARRVEELAMVERSVRMLDRARPLERQLFVRPRAGPDRHGELNRLEVQVVARVRQVPQEVGRAGIGE
jgi:hypothetical protein